MSTLDDLSSDLCREIDNRRCITAQLSKLVNRVFAVANVAERDAARYKDPENFGKQLAAILRLSVRESLEAVDESEIEPALTYLRNITP